ncbi:MAG: element excision factor XisI family protein [Trichodesmium sp. St16_bin4-tuft]|nr:XisI protein [Trichodesmium sp. MAG_R01]MDE5072053.1 element excision factor XisI family protein [Trichodesmium sp. St5_bin8]MDE5091551.1 element excision factor XisI family protein [Trichodesmium sp. St18_bin3_1_1]MDE5100653.1 element excision factor XisI family protein [Trichodesmium sp. St16_bin4-tuft]MDE5102013.1 element excision factor XisI family protein [Trichodesmium sp. St19_bin2]
MVKLHEYRQLIKEFFTEHSSHKLACGSIEVEFIFDTKGDSYQLVHAKWNKYRCIF